MGGDAHLIPETEEHPYFSTEHSRTLKAEIRIYDFS
jgi:hypothetical protein